MKLFSDFKISQEKIHHVLLVLGILFLTATALGYAAFRAGYSLDFSRFFASNCDPARLTGSFGGGQATVTNNNDVPCDVHVTIWRVFKPESDPAFISSQELHSSAEKAGLAPGATVQLAVSTPNCAYQYDIATGIPPRNSLPYGNDLIAGGINGNGGYCGGGGENPTPTPTGTFISPTEPPFTLVTLQGRYVCDTNLNGVFDGTDRLMQDINSSNQCAATSTNRKLGTTGIYASVGGRDLYVDQCNPDPYYSVAIPRGTYPVTMHTSQFAWENTSVSPIVIDKAVNDIWFFFACPEPTRILPSEPPYTPPPTLACNPPSQNVVVGAPVTLTAIGGPTSTFTWSAPGATTTTGTGSRFDTSYSSLGDPSVTRKITVTNGNQTATCEVSLSAAPIPLSCSPPNQTVNVGATANFTATGGTGTYAWFAPGGSPSVGGSSQSNSAFGTSYVAPGSHAVTVVSGGDQAVCLVTTQAIATSTPTPTVIVPTPTATVTSPSFVCGPVVQTIATGQTASLTATNAAGITWAIDGSTSVTFGAGNAQAFARYTAPGVYRAVASNANGDSATCIIVVTGPQVSSTPIIPLLTISKLVRAVSQNGLEAKNVSVAPGEVVEFVIRVTSAGSETVPTVSVRDLLPAGLVYQPGSTTIDGVAAADTILTSGALLGNMPFGMTRTVRFRAALAPSGSFVVGSSVLTNTAFARGPNVTEVSDSAFVSVVRGGGSVTLELSKLGFNQTRQEAAPHSPVSAASSDVIVFSIRVRNPGSVAVSNVTVRDVVPQAITLVPRTLTLNGAPIPDQALSSGVIVGTLAPGQEAVISFSGRVAESSRLPQGSMTIVNTATVDATGVATITAQLPISIANSIRPVANVPTGPGESAVLALGVSALLTLVYVGYLGTGVHRRREAVRVARDSHDQIDFRQ